MPRSYVYALRLRLFLEGVEIPIIAANIQSAPNSPTVAIIQVPPLSEGTKILPRTVVHLFFLDNYQTASPRIYNRAELLTRDSSNPTIYEQSLERFSKEGASAEGMDDDIFNGRYKLLFGGEVVGFQWTKNPQQRALVLKCEDFSNYWDYAYQSGNRGLFGPGIKAMFSGGGTSLFSDFLSTPGGTVASIVGSGRCSTYPNMKGLAAGIVHLVEAIGGSYYPPPTSDGSSPKRHRGQNLFFSLAELRLHITQMVSALENDTTSVTLMQRQAYSQLFNRRIGGLGGQASIRKCINAMTATIFHETYGQPSPCFIPGTPSKEVADVRRAFTSAPEAKPLVQYAVDIMEALRSVRAYVADAKETTLDPKDREKTRTRKKSVRSAKRTLKAAKRTAIGAVRYCGEDTRLTFAKKLFTEMSTYLSQLTPNIDKMHAGALPGQVQVIDKLIERIWDRAKRVPTLTLRAKEAPRIIPHRLNQQILRPDIWFGAPPRCNVIFPELYHQFTYERAFLKEPTRFLLKTHDTFFGEDFLFDKFYFAPQAGNLAGQQSTLRGVIANDLLEHELFTGILPLFEKMGEFDLFASRGAGATYGAGKVGYAQRAANFLYFKHRFAARKALVGCLFHPYIACGFPGLILDRYVDAQAIADQNERKERLRNSPEAAKWGVGGMQAISLEDGLGINYLANFSAVSHAVSQAGGEGRTEVTCTYPRQPDEKVEFLGVGHKDRTVKRRFGKDALRATDVAALIPPRVHSLGPNYGRVVNVTDVTGLYNGTANRYSPQKKALLKDLGLLEEGKRLDLYTGSRRKGAAGRSIKVPVSVPITGREYGDQITTLAGGKDTAIILRAYRVEEEIPRYRVEEKELPAEEYLRPGWYGSVWHPSRIGEAYNYFFRTGSITDPQQVADADGAPTGARTLNANDALLESIDGENRDDPRTQAPAILALDKNSSIQDAVEFILMVYSYIKMNGLDAEEFIKSYVWRPIATMVDMFGTSDLTLSEDGTKVTQGIEGFHSRAFGPYGNFYGLVTPEIRSIVNLRESSYAAQAGDTRLTKLLAVQKYATALRFTRALLG